MKLMRKIVIIFVSMTVVTAGLYYFLGQTIIEYASSGEIDRGPGRMTGAISRLTGEINKIASQSKELGEQMEIASRIEKQYGQEKANEIVNLGKKISFEKSSKIYLLDGDFKFLKELNKVNISITNDDLSNISNQAKEIMKKNENVKKGFFGGIVTTEDFPYIIGVKRVTTPDNTYNVMYVNSMDDEYIAFLSEIAGRDLAIYKGDNVSDGKLEKIDAYDRIFYCERLEDSIDFYTVLDTIGEGPQFYLRMKDDREVRNNATKNINILILYSVLIMVVANTLVYFLIKKKVLKRIININNIVNEVAAGEDLSVSLKEDISGDEISTLTTDINNMFSRLKVYSDNLEYIGNHDLLTSLMNRHRLMEYVASLREKKMDYTLFFIDLDNFKGINDTLGHNAGDALLCKVSKELLEYTESHNLSISRIGGDEFLIVREGKNNSDEIKVIANDLLRMINRIYEFDNYAYDVKASMGISFYPEHAEDEGVLLQYADIAMYCSKRSGGNSFTIFEEHMLKPLEIESKIKVALDNNEFKVFYQPIFNVDNNEIIGAEALIRWYSEGGIISPDQFIYLAKKTGDIVDIDRFVLRDTISTCREWLDSGKKDFYISINASKKFLKQKDLLEFIKEELESKNVPPSAIKLEITEDEIIDEVEYTIEILNKIKEIGVRVSLDDFGIGYSSFKHIKILPLDTIKIDRSLVENIEHDNKSKSIVNTMINLCNSLGLNVICEGIEEKEQVEIIRNLGCSSIQGYYFSRPLPKEEFNKLRVKN
ncbi:MAG: EAL domain-containing protein [Clostridium sp.]